ncbi:MAG: hypothetical protein VW644_04520, partial [Alphaproteobacteria bacterium]
AKHELTFQPDHPVGADHRPCDTGLNAAGTLRHSPTRHHGHQSNCQQAQQSANARHSAHSHP